MAEWAAAKELRLHAQEAKEGAEQKLTAEKVAAEAAWEERVRVQAETARVAAEGLATAEVTEVALKLLAAEEKVSEAQRVSR